MFKRSNFRLAAVSLSMSSSPAMSYYTSSDDADADAADDDDDDDADADDDQDNDYYESSLPPDESFFLLGYDDIAKASNDGKSNSNNVSLTRSTVTCAE